MIRFVILLFLYTTVTLSAVAQQARQYAFNRFSIANGLVSNQVAGITQDKDGYIWMATLNGLQRYDGNSFITFRHQQNKPHSIPSNNIPVVYADQKNNLWLVGEENQLGYFNTRTFKFHEVTLFPKEQKSVYRHQYFFESLDGKVLLHYKNSNLYSYDDQLKQFRPGADIIPFPANWRIHSIAVDKEGKRYWMAGDSGIVMYNPKTDILNYRGHNLENNPAIEACADVRFAFNINTTGKGSIVFATWRPGDTGAYLHRYNNNTKQRQVYNLSKELGYDYHEPYGFLSQKKGRLWVYGMPFLAEWLDQKLPFAAVPMEYKNEQSIKYDYAFNAFEDRDENIWLATDNGAFFFNPEEQVFTSYNLIRPGEETAAEASVNALLETKEGNILVGCWGKGLYNFDKQFNPIPLPASLKPYSRLSVWDMTQQTSTRLVWIALENGQLIVHDPKKNTSVLIAPPIFERSIIRQVTEDEYGNLWFGTETGKLIKWDIQQAQNDPQKGYTLVRQTGLIYKLHADNSGAMWVSTFGFGLLKLDAATNKLIKAFTKEGKEGERLMSHTSTDMSQYNDTILVVAAGGINILNTKTNKIRYITSEEGLPSDFLMSVQCDKRGTVWAGSLDGLSRVNIERKIVTNYNRSDGIVYDKFNTAGVEELEDGRVIFYTDHNFLVLDPDKFVHTNIPPKPYITSFRISGYPLSIDSLQKEGEAVLKHNTSSLTIDFSSLSFNKQRKLHYYYMLENLDKDWTHTDQSNQATYNYLPPGDYVFKVKSENADGAVSEEVATMTIVVRPPFWRTWWFFGAILLLIILILFLIDRERMNRLRSMQSIRSQIAGNLHHEINTTLNNINVLSEMAKIKAEKDVVRSKEYIQQISERSHNMIIMMDDILWSIDPKNDTMEETLLRLKEFVEALQHRHNALVSLAVDNKVLSLELDMKSRHEFFLIMKLALRMIIEDAYGTSIQVNLDRVKNNLIFKLNDSTSQNVVHLAAFNRKLEEMEARASHINAEVDVQNDRKGISIIVIVPV